MFFSLSIVILHRHQNKRTMNKFKLSFTLLLFSLFYINVRAQDDNQCGPSDSDLIEKKTENNSSNRRNTPSKQRVICYRFENNLALWLTIPEGWCHLIVEDENMNTVVFTFDSSELEFETTLPNMKGRIHLTLTTQTGRAYSGILN